VMFVYPDIRLYEYMRVCVIVLSPQVFVEIYFFATVTVTVVLDMHVF